MKKSVGKKEVYRVYDQIAEQFSATRQGSWPEFEVIYGYLEDGDRLLDVGCGNGRLLKFMPEGVDVDYLGIDPSKGMLEQAKKNCEKGRFQLGGYENLSEFEDGSFDVVVGVASFHHLESAEERLKAVEEMRRVLKVGGKLILTVWNLWQWRYKGLFWDSFWRGEFRNLMVPWKKMGVDRFYYAFRGAELKRLFKDGFRLIDFQKGNNFLIVCEKE